jgi:regulatory protein
VNSILKQTPKYERSIALQKMRKYCAYQERCHLEAKQKLYSWFMYGSDVEQIISQLIEEGFLNEERFAKAIAGGKFRQKGWGRKKIENTLKQKGISSYLITSSMKEIDGKEYVKKLEQLLNKKKETLKPESMMLQKQKLGRFAISKGYEGEMVWGMVNEMFKAV